MFALKTPCADCPFLKVGGIRLHPERVREIAGAFLTEGGGGAFPCHKTVEHGDEDGDGNTTIANPCDVSICAGGLVFAMKHATENQIMQIGRRLRWWKPDAMRGHELVFDSLEAMLATNADEF